MVQYQKCVLHVYDHAVYRKPTHSKETVTILMS